MTNAQLVKLLARVFRAAADELERAAAAEAAPERHGEIRPPSRPVTDLVRERATRALRRAGMVVQCDPPQDR